MDLLEYIVICFDDITIKYYIINALINEKKSVFDVSNTEIYTFPSGLNCH